MKKFLLIVGWLFITLSSHPAWSATGIKIMILGDSLSVGYGLSPNSGWVDLLRQRLQTQSSSYEVINISISGEITLGGRKRIEQALTIHQPAIVVIALGGNDGLQGKSIQSIYDNLETIVLTCKQHNVVPLLVGMQLPPNYGISYIRKFRDIFPRLAQHHQLQLVPFMLEGFGKNREFFLADGIHPNEHAQEKIMENIWPTLASLLESMQPLVEYKESSIQTGHIPD
ncbi:arylesterase [Nitrosomonas mobilis]|uniref:Esterase TesA n=1 Tax=Nitrosomonas mobilis TaxID=51642 RepID=A0A1G5SHI5_9PROT|nr:arylesterase [Nitrosomonas mobilis]SCZ86666.1 Esterase TesA [Nitrosomonas mobilis]